MRETTYELPFTYQMVELNDDPSQPFSRGSTPGRNIGGVLIANIYFNFFFRATGIRYEIAAQFYPNVIRFFSPDDLAAFSHHFNLAYHTPRNYGVERGKPYYSLDFEPYTNYNPSVRGRRFGERIVSHEEFNNFFEDTQFQYEVSCRPPPEDARIVRYQPEVRFQDEMELKLFCMKFGIS